MIRRMAVLDVLREMSTVFKDRLNESIERDRRAYGAYSVFSRGI